MHNFFKDARTVKRSTVKMEMNAEADEVKYWIGMYFSLATI